MLGLSFITSLVRNINGTVTDTGDGLSPGLSGTSTLLGNVLGSSGVVEDAVDNVDTQTPGGAGVDTYNDIIGPGSATTDLFDGSGVGTEPLVTSVTTTVDGLPGVTPVVQTLSPGATVVGQLNDAVLDLTEGLSPGTGWAGGATGNIIGKSGIVEDIVDNIHEGSVTGLVQDVYKDILGPGGILNNLGDGEGTGLESLVHQLGASDLVPLDAVAPVLDPAISLVDGVNGTLVGLAEGLAPGSSEAGTLTGNIIGDGGVIEDALSNLQDGSLTGAISDVYDDVFAPGGIINNIADGGGLGIEPLVGNLGDTLDGLPIGDLLDGLPIVGGEGGGGLLGGVLDGLPIVGGEGGGGLLGGVLDGLPIVGGEGGGGLLGGVLDGLPIVGDTLAGGDGGAAGNLLSDTMDQVGALLGGGDDAGGLPLLGGGLESLPVVGGLLAGLDLGLSFEGHADV